MAEIRFKTQPMFGFVSTLEKLRERAMFMKRESAMGEDLRELLVVFPSFIQHNGFLFSCVHFTFDIC